VKNLFLLACVATLVLVFAASAYARDARIDYLVNQGIVSEQDVAAAETAGPNNAMTKTATDFMIDGYIQPWFQWREDGDPETLFGVNRARLELTGKLGDAWWFTLEGEFAGGDILRKALVGVNIGGGMLEAGQGKMPLVLENMTSSGMLDTVFRSMIAGRVNEYDMGVFGEYSFLGGKIGVQAAVTNGTGLNTAETNSDKDVTVRVWAKPFLGSENPADGLMLAGAYSTGKEQEVAPIVNVGDEEIDLGDFDRTVWVGTVQWLWQQIKVQGEYINVDQDAALGGSETTDGWYVLGSYALPVSNMTIIPVAKYEQLNDTASGDWVTLGVTFAFVGTHDVKLEANYIIENLDEGSDANKFVLQVTANY
jgi:hypothetical protein